MKKVLKDVLVFALLMAAMFVFCGFEGNVLLCSVANGFYPFELYVQSEDCDVLETSSEETPSFEVSIPRGKAATLKVNGMIHKVPGELSIMVRESDLPQGVTCSEVTVTTTPSGEDKSNYAYEFSVSIPASLEKDFDLTLIDGSNSIKTAKIGINRIDSQPKTGDSSCAALWITLLCMSGAAALVLRRREHN